MASAPPRPGRARNSQADCSAVDLDSRAGGAAFDDPSGNRAIAFSHLISASPTSASGTFHSPKAQAWRASSGRRPDRLPRRQLDDSARRVAGLQSATGAHLPARNRAKTPVVAVTATPSTAGSRHNRSTALDEAEQRGIDEEAQAEGDPDAPVGSLEQRRIVLALLRGDVHPDGEEPDREQGVDNDMRRDDERVGSERHGNEQAGERRDERRVAGE